MPRYAIGTLSPVGGIDTMPYGMYRLLGPDFIVISVSLALQSFKPEDLERAVAAIEPQADHLVSRGADLILQSGTPLALSLGPEGLARLLARLHDKFGVPGNDTINRQLAAFLSNWDIELIGSAAESQEPAQFQSADLRESAELAYHLGRQALERTPAADALFIGGGSWFTDPAAERLEQEFGKPVITSLNGAVRATLKALGCWGPFPPGSGRVLEVA
jgi:maleate cis-trans isomerase